MRRQVSKGLLADRVISGARLALRVTPAARENSVTADANIIHIKTTAPADAGRANDAVRDMLARALGIAPSRLKLLQGATARDKLFQLD